MYETDCGPAQVITLLAIRPGWWRNAFMAYLQAIPQLCVVVTPAKPGELLKTLDKVRAQTLVLEATIFTPHLPFVLQVLRTTHPNLNIIIIADTLGEYHMAIQGEVDRVLLKSDLRGALDPTLFLSHIPH